MFGFLKKKLSESVERLSEKIKKKEAEERPVEKPVEKVEREKEIRKPERKPEVPKPAKTRKRARSEREVEKPPEAEKEVGIPKEEPKVEKRGFLARLRGKPELKEEEKPTIRERVVGRVLERKVSGKDIDSLFEEMELGLIEANVAVETIDFLKSRMKEYLVNKQLKRGEIEKEIRKTLESILVEIFDQGKVELERLAKKKKPVSIVFLGFNGSGKCVSGDTMIPLSDGTILTIKEIYEKSKALFSETKVNGGFTVDSKNMLKVFSLDTRTLKILEKPVERLWKLKKDRLLKIELGNGFNIKVTPEHPFFVLRSGGIEKVRADRLSHNDYVTIPKSVIPTKTKIISKLEMLKKIEDRKLFLCSENFVKKSYEFMEKKYGKFKNAWLALNKIVNANESTFVCLWKNEKRMPLPLVLELCKINPSLEKYIDKIKIKYGRSKPIEIPEFKEDFYEFLGLFYAEGHVGKNYIEFTNTDKFLLKKFSTLTTSLFKIRNVNVKEDKRNTKVKRCLISNSTLSFLMRNLFCIPLKRKNAFMKLPNFMISCPNKHISAFLRAYWECDGYISSSQRTLEMSTASKVFAKQISVILLRFGIITTWGVKRIHGKDYYRLSIFGKGKIESFNGHIGVLTKKSRDKLNSILNMPHQFEKTELVPNQGELLKQIRINSGIEQKVLAKQMEVAPSLISQYERYNYNTSMPIDKVCNFASIINTEDEFFVNLKEGDARWLKVKSIKQIKSEENYVYDMTVSDFHNFVAENFIVHNTTSIAKLGKYLTSKKFKVVLAAGDTFRAASIEQLDVHGNRLGLKVIKHDYGADSAAVVYDAVEHAKAKGIDFVLADTAGRSHPNRNLMDELKKVVRVNKPDLKILVMDSLTGNDLVEQARNFDEAVGIDAMIFTKVDVNEKGGGMLSACYAVKKPILYIGLGQEYGDIEIFDPKKFVKDLMGG